MNHADVQSHLADYLEGDLAISKRALFDAHLDRCTECNQEVEEMRSTVSLLRGLPDPEPPATLAADVMRRIRLGEAQPGLFDRIASWIDELTTPRIMVPVASFAAGMAVILVTGLVDVQMPGVATETPQYSAQREAAPASPVAEPTREMQVAAAPVRRPTMPPRLSPQRTGVREFPLMTMPPSQPSLASQDGRPVANLVIANGGAPVDRGVQTNRDNAGASDPVARQERARQALDQRLDAALMDPSSLIGEFAAYDDVEKELWIRLLAERAGERGDAERVLLALQASEDSGGLASAFAAAMGGTDPAEGGE